MIVSSHALPLSPDRPGFQRDRPEMSKPSKSELKNVPTVTATLPLLPIRLPKVNHPVPRASNEASFPLTFETNYANDQLVFLSDDPINERPVITIICCNPSDQTFMVMVCTSSSILFNVTPPFCYAYKGAKTLFRVHFIGAFVPMVCQKVAFYAQPINITHLPARVVSNCGVRQQQTGVHRFRIRFYNTNSVALTGKVDIKNEADRNLVMEFPRLSVMPQGVDKLIDKEKEQTRFEKPVKGPTPGRNYDWRKTVMPPPAEAVKPRPKDPDEAMKYDIDLIKKLPVEARLALYKKRFEEDKSFRFLLAKELGKRDWGSYEPSDEVVSLLKDIAAGKKVKIPKMLKRELTKHCHSAAINYEEHRKHRKYNPLVSTVVSGDPKRKSKESTSDSRSRNRKFRKRATNTRSPGNTTRRTVVTKTTVNNPSTEDRAPTMLRHKRGQLGIIKTERVVDHQRKKFVKTAQTLSMETTQRPSTTENDRRDTPGHPAEVWTTLREQLGRIMQCNPRHPSLIYNKQRQQEKGERGKRKSQRHKLSNTPSAVALRPLKEA